jgi:hypothetical protein
MLSFGFGLQAEPQGVLNECEQDRRLRHIAGLRNRQAEVPKSLEKFPWGMCGQAVRDAFTALDTR